MKYLTLSLFFLGLCLETWSQETVGAPYNPDSNADSLISVPDILSIIPLFGQEFLPSEDDLDSTNEIQSLYISNDTLYLVPNGGFILLGDIAPQINLDSLVSSLSVDSTFLANVGGIGSGGCDLSVPDGFADLQPVHHNFFNDGDFIIPSGSNLYLTHWNLGPHDGDASVDGEMLIDGHYISWTDMAGGGLNHPLLVGGGGSVITSTNPNVSTSSSKTFTGFMVEGSVTPLIENIGSTGVSSYVVPDGKLFVLRWVYANNPTASLSINGGRFLNTGGVAGQGMQMNHPVVLGPGSILEASTAGDFNIVGYTVDEDYFDGCTSPSSVTGDNESISVEDIYCLEAGVTEEVSESDCPFIESFCTPSTLYGFPVYEFGNGNASCEDQPNWRRMRVDVSGNLSWVESVVLYFPDVNTNGFGQPYLTPSYWVAGAELVESGIEFVISRNGIAPLDADPAVFNWPPSSSEVDIAATLPYEIWLTGGGRQFTLPFKLFMRF